MGAVGQYQQGQAANANAIANYKHQIEMRELQWRNELTTWRHRRVEYKNEKRANQEAAFRGYAAEQTRLNEQFMQAAFQKQDMLASLIQQQGMLGERQGVSANRMNVAMLGQYGRNNATIAESLVSARNAMMERNTDIRRQQFSATKKAYSQVALKPIAGFAPPPPQLSNPGIGLAAGLLGAAAQGFNAFQGLQAPPAGGGAGASVSTNFGNYNVPNHSYSFPSSTGVNWSMAQNFQY